MTLKKHSFRRSSRSCSLPALLSGQGKGVDPARAAQAARRSWPTYSGDYTGTRYSALKQIDRTNVKNLTLAWVRTCRRAGTSGLRWPRRAGRRRGTGPATPLIVGGEGTGEFSAGGMTTIKASALVVDGTIYISTPDNAWAIDARDGRELWHYFWKTRGGTHIANRGLGMWNDYLYMETPDNYLVSLDAKTGKERWHKVIADFSQQYFSTTAPIVIGNHVLVGTGNDLDAPGFLQSFDPETGELQWKFYTVPMNPGDPGLDTWPSLDAARHGGAQPWMPGAYDPETNLYIFGTGNPTPGVHRRPRRGRQPVHLLADRRERRHRQDGLVLPDVAARHARLGLGADAGPVRRARSTARCASWSRPRRATATSSRSIARPASDRDEQVRLVHQLGGKGSTKSAAGREPEKDPRRSAARSSRRPRAARSTGSRRRTRPTPASSTSRSTTAIRFSI